MVKSEREQTEILHASRKRRRSTDIERCNEAHKLRAWRRDLNATQAWMAEALGVTQPTYSRLESCTDPDRFENLLRTGHFAHGTDAGRKKAAADHGNRRYIRLAQALDLSPEQLLSKLGLAAVDDADDDDLDVEFIEVDDEMTFAPAEFRGTINNDLAAAFPVHGLESLHEVCRDELFSASPKSVGAIQLPRELARSLTSERKSLLAVLWTDEFAEGPSRLRAGDLLCIRQGQFPLRDTELYLIEHRRHLFIRRARFEKGRWWLASDAWNRVQHPTFKAREDDVRVKGIVSPLAAEYATYSITVSTNEKRRKKRRGSTGQKEGAKSKQ